MGKNLEFKTIGDWKIQGSNEKGLYIGLVTKINDWKKSIGFRRSDIGEEAFTFLLNQILEKKTFSDWEFSVSTSGGRMNIIYASQVFWVKDQLGNIIFEEQKNVNQNA